MNLESWLLSVMTMASLLLGGAPKHLEIVRLAILQQSLILLPIIWFYLMQLQFRDTEKNIKYDKQFLSCYELLLICFLGKYSS